MKIKVNQAMVDALDEATDKPDWLIQKLAQLKGVSEPHLLTLTNQESTALEELCAMNIRFDASGAVLPKHKPLDELSLLVMQNY